MSNVVYNNSIHEHFTRGVQKAHAIYRRTEKVRKGFLNVGLHYWSNLPLSHVLKQLMLSIDSIKDIYVKLYQYSFISVSCLYNLQYVGIKKVLNLG